jgi:hypothetical protein
MISRFFQGGKDILARIEEELVEALIGPIIPGKARLFEDQYICTGGQFYELMAGHDRFNADLRPNLEAALAERGQHLGICCHPYDLCTELIAREMGVQIVKPDGTPLDAPLDTTTPVAWVGYANQSLRSQIEPVLTAILARTNRHVTLVLIKRFITLVSMHLPLILLFSFCSILLSNPVFADDMGKVRFVSGDLVYISGMNRSAPVGSQLAANSTSDPSLEVIKHLRDMVIARKLEYKTEANKNDRFVTVKRPTGEARRQARAVRVAEGPKVDGRLDDAVWDQAIPVDGFIQREPDYWMPSTERTVVRIVYDDEQIYFSFECFTSDRYRLVANNMRRDSEIHGDDNIQLLLDTYNDKQTGFFFFVNPLGAQRDLMLSNEGRSYNEDWDCNWVSKTQTYKDRWTVEVAIPFNQLRFKPSEEMVWGINMARNIAAMNEESQFVVGRRSSSTRARYWTSDIGELRGLSRLDSKRSVLIKPYALPGTSRDYETAGASEKGVFETGVDLRYGVTPNISFDLSYNTDFAQVEGDQEQVNLTQFKLFFPEKREFFLEGSNLFDFGQAAERTGGGSRPPTLLFYSRRIGLEEGGKIPIIFGNKLAGKEGRTSIGVLNVLSDDALVIDVDDDDTTNVNQTNYSVVRLKRDVMSRSNVGMILVNKQENDPLEGWSPYNRVLGVDFSLSPTERLNIQGFYARTWDSVIDDADDARYLSLDYSGAITSFRARILDVEEQFEPAVGFVNRRGDLDGFRRYDLSARMRPQLKPGNRMNIRSFSVGPQLQVVTDRENNVKFWTAEFSAWTQFVPGDYWRMEFQHTHDVVEEAFAPSDRRPDVGIPIGTYDFSTFTMGPSPSRSRKFRPRVFFEAGSFYTGHRYGIRSEVVFQPSGRLSIESDLDANWIRLPQANLNLVALTTRVIYSFSTDFFVKFFAQINNDKEIVSTNFLLNYRYRPGSDVFLVFDNGFGTDNAFRRQSRSVLLKWSYLVGL